MTADVAPAGSYVSHSGDGTDALVATPLEDGVRLAAVLQNEESAESISFPLPAETEAEVQPDGSIVLYSTPQSIEAEDGTTFELSLPVALVGQPWAVDASGRTIPTSYLVDGDTIVQSVAVNEDTVYPVVADPTFQPLNPV